MPWVGVGIVTKEVIIRDKWVLNILYLCTCIYVYASVYSFMIARIPVYVEWLIKVLDPLNLI